MLRGAPCDEGGQRVRKWPRLTANQLLVLQHGAYSFEVPIGWRRIEKWCLDLPDGPRVNVSSSVKSLHKRGLLRLFHTHCRAEVKRGMLRRTFTVISPRMRG